MSLLKQYKWEATHATIILGVITTLALVTHLTGTPPPKTRIASTVATLTPPSQSSAGAPAPPKAPSTSAADPREVVVGPSGINSRYTLISADTRPLSSTVDELTIKLHVVSLATENLVSPSGSDMMEIRSPDHEPITPRTAFHTPIPAGETRNEEVVFNIPSGLNLANAVLHIHYYNYQSQIPLNLAAHTPSD